MEDAVNVENLQQCYRSLNKYLNIITTITNTTHICKQYNHHKHNSHLQTISFGHVLSKLWILCLAYWEGNAHITSFPVFQSRYSQVSQSHST